MNLVDAGIVVFVIALAAVGYERGLIASALPLAGFVGGAALGARIGPELLDGGSQSQYAPLVAVSTGILVGAFLAVALDGIAQSLSPSGGRARSACSTASAAPCSSSGSGCSSPGGLAPSPSTSAAATAASCARASSSRRSWRR